MQAQVEALAGGLRAALVRAGLAGDVVGLERLSGGANMESWAFELGGEAFVLRRAPSAAMMEGRPLDLTAEAAVIRTARDSGVPAPEIVAELSPEDGLGSGFVMRRIAGTAAPATLLSQGGREFLRDIATALVAVHRVDPVAVPQTPELNPAVGVEGLAAQFEVHGGDRPIVALGLAWLRANLPGPAPARLVHGDFRIGNLMAQRGRLTGVLDWEIAHRGDFHEDLAYGCMAVWRFGSSKPGFGVGSLEELFAAYRDAGGDSVDPRRFRFWLIYRTVWWALGCLGMGETWRSGADRSIERVVVGRRVAEQELDLLLALEDEAPETERARPLPPAAAPVSPSAPGEPSAAEIVTAVSEWLATVKDRFSGRERFDHAVARNALGIVARELAAHPAISDRELADDILAGRASLTTVNLLARLKRMALDKLVADQPKYPSLATAREKWEHT